jgi:uncharacterized protein
MNNLFVPRVGAVFSADIAVPEHEREIRFYSRVLSTGDTPLWREEDLMNNLGWPIIGLGERSAEYANLPLQWMPHVQVADVAASVRQALEIGGCLLMDSKDSDGATEWAVLQDPNDAAFGIISVIPQGATPEAEGGTSADTGSPIGRIAWLDLTVPNARATRDFYSHVIGWSTQHVEMTDGDARYADYNMLGQDGSALAGICHARGANAGLPAVWMIYLPVGDLAESIDRVEREGGRVIKSTRDLDGRYQYVAIQDPVGASLALIQG